MKKIFTLFAILAAVMLTPSCQKELPDAIKNVDVNKGEQTPSPKPTPAPTPTPTPDTPTQQGEIPSEGDNPWPGY